MAAIGRIASMLMALGDAERRIFVTIFTYLLSDVRFGRAKDQSRSQNFAATFHFGITPHVASTEFSILHGRPSPPYLLIPVCALDSVASTLVPLVVTRVADANRVYLSSTVIDTPYTILIEG
jgi:hypothetical protein